MSYKLETCEAFSFGIKRITTEELGSALEGLRGGLAEGDRGTVHDTRKRFKKLRAICRLVKSDLGKNSFREVNVLLRDAGRELSGLRDAQVLVETLAALRERFPDEVYQQAFARVHKSLLERQRLVEAQGNVPTAEVAAKVAILEERMTHLHVSDDWDAVAPNLERVYERGLAAFKKAFRHPTDEGFHNWRKGVKNLWYHLRILNPLWPEVITVLAAQAGMLADLLGDEHDLAVLSQTLAAERKALGKVKEVKAIQVLSETRRDELRREARLLGRRLYADKPQRFTKRLGAYWKAWQKECEQ